MKVFLRTSLVMLLFVNAVTAPLKASCEQIFGEKFKHRFADMHEDIVVIKHVVDRTKKMLLSHHLIIENHIELIRLAINKYFSMRFPELQEGPYRLKWVDHAFQQYMAMEHASRTSDERPALRLPVNESLYVGLTLSKFSLRNQIQEAMARETQTDYLSWTQKQPTTFDASFVSDRPLSNEERQRLQSIVSHLDHLNRLAIVAQLPAIGSMRFVQSPATEDSPKASLLVPEVFFNFEEAFTLESDHRYITYRHDSTPDATSLDKRRYFLHLALSHEWGHVQYMEALRQFYGQKIGLPVISDETIGYMAYEVFSEIARSLDFQVRALRPDFTEDNVQSFTHTLMRQAYDDINAHHEDFMNLLGQQRQSSFQRIYASTLDCHEVYADLVAVMEAMNPQAMALIMPQGSWNRKVLDFTLNPTRLLADKGFQQAQFAQAHLRHLLRYLVYYYYYLKKGRQLGESKQYDAQVMSDVFHIFAPINLMDQSGAFIDDGGLDAHDRNAINYNWPTSVKAAARISRMSIRKFLMQNPWVVLRLLQIPQYQTEIVNFLSHDEEIRAYFASRFPLVVQEDKIEMAQLESALENYLD